MPHRAHLSNEQKRAAIPKLTKRIDELKAFDPRSMQNRYEPQITTLEQAIERTLLDTFDPDTIEYKRYHNATSINRSGIYIGRPTPIHEVVDGLERGKDHAIAILEEIIRGFREDLAGC